KRRETNYTDYVIDDFIHLYITELFRACLAFLSQLSINKKKLTCSEWEEDPISEDDDINSHIEGSIKLLFFLLYFDDLAVVL
ncbi:hypothetical protein ACJX0J_014003, partial [Zea mays]